MMAEPVYLVRGSDPILRERALHDLIEELLGDTDRTLAVEDILIPGRGESDSSGADGRAEAILKALSAAESPPFMTERRIVILRDIQHLLTAECESLVRYLENPMPTTSLVMVAGQGKISPALAKIARDVGEEFGPASEDTADVIAEALQEHGVSLTPDAKKLMQSHVGDEAGRIPQLVETLASVYGEAKLGVDEVQPYLGDQGSVPIYKLSNAIEAGDVPGALEVLHRLLNATGPTQPRPMHPLQILASLHNTYRRLMRLDDPSICSERDAIDALGGKVKPYPAKKALAQARALGPSGIVRAAGYLEAADLDLKGKRAIPADAVISVLVARLAGLSARGGRR